MPITPAIQIWRLSDGRAGHDSQSLGLVDALSRLHPVEALTITVSNAWHGVQQVLGKRNRQPRPEIVIGAGHSTHASLIAGAWRHRARSIVLMNPSFPYALFDLCIVPKHDKVQARPNVLQSVGALNQVQVSTRRDPKLALILLGGPSRHFQWQHECVLTQIRKLLEARASMHWLIASSPRTPAQMMLALEALENVQLMRFEDTPSDWLTAKLVQASLVWVTEDSMSMAYEALSSGAATGLLQVSTRGTTEDHARVAGRATSKLAAAMRELRRSGRIMAMEQWLAGTEQGNSMQPLREADRCARQILERWPDLR